MLIKCPQCKRYLTDKSVSCPYCGYEIKNDLVPQPKPTFEPLPAQAPTQEMEIEPQFEPAPAIEPDVSSEMAEVPRHAPSFTDPVAPVQKVERSNIPLFAIITVLIILAGCIGGYLYYDKVYSTGLVEQVEQHSSDNSLQNDMEKLYDRAMAQINSEDRDTLRQGLIQMESLSNKNYIPAMFQMAFTYGWFSDYSSVRRKKMLDIPVKDNGMPISDHYNRMAIDLFTKIAELSDSSYTGINAQSCYRMAGYYIEKNNVQVQDYAAGKQWLLRAKEWARMSADESGLLGSIDKGLSLIEAYEKSIRNNSSL